MTASVDHKGKAGIYLRLGAKEGSQVQQELLRTHPLLDAIVLSARWADVEPERGRYGFTALRLQVEKWSAAGKGVTISRTLYGQSPSDDQTPAWLYLEPGVRSITFAGGGAAKGQMVRVPAVWDDSFVKKYLKPLVAALAKEFDGHPGLQYVMPGFGHISNMNAQPSKEGRIAFLEAGWTPELWVDYCQRLAALYRRNFLNTPLLVKAAGKLLDNPDTDDYKLEAAALIEDLGKQGMAIIKLGLETDVELMNEVHQSLVGIIPTALEGRTRIGLGDDWPLWVPEDRRGPGPTEGRDDANLALALEYAFGGLDGIPELPTSLLFCQLPEILASHPESPDYEPGVFAALENARERLKAVDRQLFGAP